MDRDVSGGICAGCGATIALPYDDASAETMGAVSASGQSDATKAARVAAGHTSSMRTGSSPSASGVLQPGDAFGSRYRILRTLGAGGMGVVYHSWDDELGVAVALKVIRPEVMDDPEAARELERRFKRELLLARQVTHKNVVRIHDMGDVGGVKYLTMPFVEGRDLGSILRDSGTIPVPRALRIARQVAAGLQAAHDAGVVHRDLKPENIMVEAEDQALIMDFGISRSMTGTGAGTMLGAVVGTLEYMAPEQGRGQPVDHRADIYAFGLMLYDMLAGRRRLEAAENPAAEMMSRMQQPPAPLRPIAPSVPEPLERVVSRCLEPDPAKRYATTAELVADLDRLDPSGHLLPAAVRARSQQRRMIATAAILAILVTMALLAAVGFAFRWTGWFTAGSPSAAERDPVSVLIADFQNNVGDPVFDSALEDALSVAMEGASFITSYPRAAAQRTLAQLRPGATLDEAGARNVSQRDGIGVVLAGMIERDGSDYRVTVTALDAIPGTALATASATAASKAQVLEAVGTVAARIREALGDATIESVALAAKESITATSLEAAREFSLGVALANQAKDEQAIAHFREAIRLDPNFGRAYGGWALSAGKLGQTQESADLWSKALANVDRMTEREKYRTLGNYYRVVGNHEKELETYRMLAGKYPADGAAHNNLALAYFNTLDFVKAREAGARVVTIYPRSVLYRYNHALYAMYAGDFDTAESEAREALKINPQTPKAYIALAVAAMMKGNQQAAENVYKEAAEKAGPRGLSFSRIGLADLAMYRGAYDSVPAILEPGVADDLGRKDQTGAAAKLIAIAEARLAAGDRSGAVEAAKRAIATSDNQEPTVGAARILIAAGRQADARPLADRLAKELEPRLRAYAKLLEGEAALSRGKLAESIDALRAAQKLADLWLVRFELGRAYIEAARFAEALSEIELCVNRRGEATAVFLDDMPSIRYLAPLPYWLARAQEGLKSQGAAENYRRYLSLRPPASDPLAADAERRLKLTP